jgi:prepilin-type N-terminal cleavage/methylation domain-containing protein
MRFSRNPRGITLVEIVVVMAIMGLMLGMSTIGIRAIVGVDLKAASRTIAANIRWTYNSAALAGVHYRMVLDLENGTFETEVADKRFLLAQSKRDGNRGKDVEDATNLEEDELRDRDDDSEATSQPLASGSGEGDEMGYSLSGDFDAGEQKIAFSKVQDRIISETKLDDKIVIAGVYTSHQNDLYTEGVATINFFPNGFVEPSLILLAEKDSTDFYWQIKVHPLTGRVRITKIKQEDFVLPEEFGMEKFVEDESI